LEKRDIALAEIRRAIQLFRKTDYVCAATLAGAAEEILGRIAKKRAGHNALDGHEAFAKGMAEWFSVPAPDRAKVRAVMNRVRNECKHNDSGDNEWVEADFEYEAQELIDRALRNWLLAYGGFPKDRIVAAYYTQYWL
jgi:hypothetical protein